MPETATPQARAFAVALGELAHSERLLVALDFDGTLSPLVDRPGEARVLPKAAEALAVLEGLPHTWVAYVSGRPLESLATLTEADDAALLIGSHGVEMRLDGGGVSLGLSEDERERLARLDAALTRIVDGTPGAALERKPAGLAVHSRLVDRAAVPALQAAARSAASSIGGFFPRDGKEVVEFSARDATKADGIETLRRRVNASAVLYAGDDVTDEDAFAVLHDGDVGVKVGEGTTAALFRVADPDAVAVMLTLLAGARTNAVSE